MGPIDYRLNIPDPTQAVLSAAQGMGQLGLAQQQNQWAQQQHQWTEEDRARALQEAELQKQAQLAQQKALYELSQNPTPENITRTMVRYPALAEHLQKAHGNVSEAQTSQVFSSLGPIASALNNGKPNVAVDILTQQKQAMENAGNTQGAQAVGAILSIAKDNPSAAQMMVNGRLYAADPKRFESMFKTPEEAAKLRAEAGKTAEEAAQVAPLAAAEMGVKKATGVKAYAEAGKAKEETISEKLLRPGQIAKIEAQAVKERAEAEKLSGAGGNAPELAARVDALVSDLTTKDALSALDGITGPRNQAKPVWAMTQAQADVNSALNNLKSDVFLGQVNQMRGMGALTEAEGAKLETAVASLDRSQSIAQLKKNLGIIQETMQNAAKRTAARGQAGAAGSAASVRAAADAILSGGK